MIHAKAQKHGSGLVWLENGLGEGGWGRGQKNEAGEIAWSHLKKHCCDIQRISDQPIGIGKSKKG